MKKLVSIIVILSAIAILCFGLFTKTEKNDYIRIYILANSNLEIDQNVKYEIKDKIISYLLPYISLCETREDFVSVINNSIDGIENVANKVLKEKNFSYKANVKFCEENFPTREYNSLVLESGLYDAIIVNLGEAKGDNWWCVVYPPLCFISNCFTIFSFLATNILNFIYFFTCFFFWPIKANFP